MSRLYLDTPYAEPKGFWKRLLWWVRQDYREAEHWQQDERIRVDEARRIAADLRKQFPSSVVPDYIEREFGGDHA